MAGADASNGQASVAERLRRRFADALDCVSDAFYALDAEWRVVAFNRAAERYFGFGAETVLNKKLWEIFPEGRGTEFGDALQAAMALRESATLDTVSSLTPGRAIKVSVAPWDDGICVAITDVTAHSEAERQLQHSEDRLRLATEGAGIGAYELDTLSGEGFWSPSAFRLLGLEPAADLKGTFAQWRAAIHPEDVERLVREHQDAAARGGSWRSEYRIIRQSDGQTRWVETYGQFVPRGERRVHSLGIAVDITERKQAELERREFEAAFREALAAAVDERTRELQESEARLKSIFETSHMYSGLLSPDGMMLFANATALEGVGLTLADVVGKPIWLTPWFANTPGVSERVREVVAKVAAGESVNSAIQLDLPAGRRHFDFAMRPVRNERGEIVHLLPEAVDVTSRVEAENALRQAQKLEAVGQLTGGIAHDFNNLLMIISGGLNMLERKDEPGRREMLVGRMREAVERGAKLTQQLLAFSRKRELAPSTIDFAAHVEAMRELLDRSLGGHVRVAVDIAPGLPPIFVDQNGLQQALLNLAVNARDAMPEGGVITIRAAAHSDAGAVGISVIDTGAGMSDEIVARIFEPFFTTKDVGKGSGLGLAQVHGFAEQSGGRVEVMSVLGEGTTITLVLPKARHDQAALAPPPVTVAPQGAPAGSVLLVEDDNEVAALTTDLLEELGWRVTRAASGEAALQELAKGASFDLVFSDVMMPGGMNGLELAQRIRDRAPKLPILLTSGYAAPVEREAAKAGLPLLPKPFTFDGLSDALGQVLAR